MCLRKEIGVELAGRLLRRWLEQTTTQPEERSGTSRLPRGIGVTRQSHLVSGVCEPGGRMASEIRQNVVSLSDELRSGALQALAQVVHSESDIRASRSSGVH